MPGGCHVENVPPAYTAFPGLKGRVRAFPYSRKRALKRAMGLLPPSVLSINRTAKSVTTWPNVPYFSQIHKVVDKASRPLSDTWENCLGDIPSTTEVLGLKLAEAVRSNWAVKSCVLVEVSWLASEGVVAVVSEHFQ
jgi:hypothetical protein